MRPHNFRKISLQCQSLNLLRPAQNTSRWSIGRSGTVSGVLQSFPEQFRDHNGFERCNCDYKGNDGCYGLLFQDDQAGVIPRRSFHPKSYGVKEARFFRGVASNGSRGNSMNGRQESQYSDESESGDVSKVPCWIITLTMGCLGHGILEFSTDKAGQDVTPLNLEFGEEKRRSSTLNSITGKLDADWTRIELTLDIITPIFFDYWSFVLFFFLMDSNPSTTLQ